MTELYDLPMGLYEKTMPLCWSWKEKLAGVRRAGYDFLEMSIDSSKERFARLSWDDAQIGELKEAVRITGIPVRTVALSANRDYNFGSKEEQIRKQAVDIVKKAVCLADAVGIRVIQLATYDVFGDGGDEKTCALFYESIEKCARFAATYGVMLAMETMDTEFADSVKKVMRIVRCVDSPYLQIYADIGNITAAGYALGHELIHGGNHIVAIHLKDTKPGVVRRVKYGAGTVDFKNNFRTIKEMGFQGIFVAEMWGDEDPAYVEYAGEALRFLKNSMREQ